MLEQSGEQVRVDLDEVLSVEVCGHYTTICLTDGEKLEIKQSFAAVLGRLNEAVGAGQMGRIGSGREAAQIFSMCHFYNFFGNGNVIFKIFF